MKNIFIIYGLGAIGIFILAIIYGPSSCAGGLTVYFKAGILFLILSIVLPFFIKEPTSKQRTGLLILGLAALSVIVWIAGFALGNFRIMCKLF